MKRLALDTSTDLASVALLLDEEILSLEKAGVKTHAQSLLPMIEELLSQASMAVSQLDALVFGCGPGSFTGLRIACSITQGLAAAHDLAVIPVGSLDAITYAVHQTKDAAPYPILSLIDARMQQLYWGYYPVDTESVSARVDDTSAIIIPPGPVIIAGVGFEAYWEELPLTIRQNCVGQIPCYPHAKTLLQLAKDKKPMAAEAAQPVYVRNEVIQNQGKNHG